MTKLLSHRHPALYWLGVRWNRVKRRVGWMMDGERYVSNDGNEQLKFLVKRHSTRLIKQLGDSRMRLQLNKVENLKLVLACLDGVIIRPGESFSFCRLVGKPTAKRGFKEGMELSMGKAQSGIGGGICQMANLLNWLVMHSPLTVIERSSHSFDPFPDQNRSIPFGTGCAVFYNYVDFRFRNDTRRAFQLKLWMDETQLWGELLSDVEIEETYKVFEEDHAFVEKDGQWWRRNRIMRRVMVRRGGRFLRNEEVKRNFVRVMYEPDERRDPISEV
ncbi:MAG: VanW family protein [Akkermansiaceae bacterium]